jgi:RNA polymerase sigma factor for flagellar operon FliA
MNAVKNAYETVCHIDEEERNRLLLEQLPQVRYIARRIHDRLPQSVCVEDLVHAGVLGLIDALAKYDPTKNVQLKSYAKFRIRGAILDSLRGLDWSPRDLRRKARQMETVHSQFKAEHGRAATEPELAVAMGLELDDFYIFLRDLRGLDLGSLEMESSEDGHETMALAGASTQPEDDPFHICMKTEMKELLTAAIGDLPEKERQVLALYYYEELTMKEIGQVLGVGESRVSQIHSAAVVRLRASMRPAIETRPSGKKAHSVSI